MLDTDGEVGISCSTLDSTLRRQLTMARGRARLCRPGSRIADLFAVLYFHELRTISDLLPDATVSFCQPATTRSRFGRCWRNAASSRSMSSQLTVPTAVAWR